MILIIYSFLLSVGFGAETSSVNAASGNSISGTPRLIRQMPETEVFFKDLPQSYFIPRTSSHNRIFDAVMKAQKAGKAISLKVDPKSRQIVDTADGPQLPVMVSGEN